MNRRRQLAAIATIALASARRALTVATTGGGDPGRDVASPMATRAATRASPWGGSQGVFTRPLE